ncbi:MAG: S8 family peptidase [Bacteroidales bacterium]|nr:S8 family peptidase [Clostridium sp.]MCM1203940.1 S8 family peptidase [Bacteroidales bacterium]
MSSSPKIPALISGARALHEQGYTGDRVTVAIMDSGIAPHPDIAGERILAFQDFISNRNFPYDDYSHGTHVAGIIGGTKTGIAPQCRLVCLKVLDRTGNGSTDIFIEGIRWILAHHEEYRIQIVNISVGGINDELKNERNRLNLWVTRLWERGLVVCCSAGNNGPNPNSITAPGNCKKIITIGSSDGGHFSSAGPLLPFITKPELVAPGTNILSLKPGGGYIRKSGTSMSVPFISGACALLLQQRPYLTNDQIKIRLMESAYTVPYLPYNMQGAGIVNLKRLLTG